MLKNLIEKIGSRVVVNAFDPASLQDPVALLTEWKPAKGGGTNFRTHRLDRSNPQRLEFRCTIGMMLFAGAFFAVGIAALGVTIKTYATQFEQTDLAPLIMMPVSSLAFGGAGGWMLFSSLVPAVFDLNHGYYCRSRKRPEHSLHPTQIKHYTPLDQIHALQLISECCQGKNSSYYSYELNLVLVDGTRLNVVDHGNCQAIREDARAIAEALGKPLWDAS